MREEGQTQEDGDQAGMRSPSEGSLWEWERPLSASGLGDRLGTLSERERSDHDEYGPLREEMVASGSWPLLTSRSGQVSLGPLMKEEEEMEMEEEVVVMMKVMVKESEKPWPQRDLVGTRWKRVGTDTAGG